MVENIIMLPVRQKQIVETIEQAGLKKTEVEFIPTGPNKFEIYYKKNKFYCFKIDQKNTFKGIPGSDGRLAFQGQLKEWEGCLKALGIWVKYVLQNISIGNPWEEIENQKEDFTEMNFDNYEELFSTDEQNKIADKLDKLLVEFERLHIDVTSITSDLDHLKSMSNQISKKDWILLFLGNITSWTFTNIIPNEHTNTIWEIVKDLFSGFNIKLLF
jgi:hypothetical protein